MCEYESARPLRRVDLHGDIVEGIVGKFLEGVLVQEVVLAGRWFVHLVYPWQGGVGELQAPALTDFSPQAAGTGADEELQVLPVGVATDALADGPLPDASGAHAFLPPLEAAFQKEGAELIGIYVGLVRRVVAVQLLELVHDSSVDLRRIAGPGPTPVRLGVFNCMGPHDAEPIVIAVIEIAQLLYGKSGVGDDAGPGGRR